MHEHYGFDPKCLPKLFSRWVLVKKERCGLRCNNLFIFEKADRYQATAGCVCIILPSWVLHQSDRTASEPFWRHHQDASAKRAAPAARTSHPLSEQLWHPNGCERPKNRCPRNRRNATSSRVIFSERPVVVGGVLLFHVHRGGWDTDFGTDAPFLFKTVSLIIQDLRKPVCRRDL